MAGDLTNHRVPAKEDCKSSDGAAVEKTSTQTPRSTIAPKIVSPTSGTPPSRPIGGPIHAIRIRPSGLGFIRGQLAKSIQDHDPGVWRRDWIPGGPGASGECSARVDGQWA